MCDWSLTKLFGLAGRTNATGGKKERLNSNSGNGGGRDRKESETSSGGQKSKRGSRQQQPRE